MPSVSTPRQATPKDIWQNAKADLELQMARATYDTWIRDTRFLAYEDGEFVIGVSSSFALDWLNTRLRPLIKRTLVRLAERSVDVRFVAQPKDAPEAPTTPAPLLEMGAASATPAQARAAGAAAMLNPRYTFASFVVGNSNRLAYVASQTVAEQPGQAYNPLFIYGGVGLGKTHLMHSIGRETGGHGRRVLYVTSEGFTNDFIESLKNGTPESFRDKYRTVDVLLLDDVQFIAGKTSTQEELFHTFNALHMASRQIVLTADSMPDQIAALENRLGSRFKSGLCVDLQPPNLETRIAILRAKAGTAGRIELPDEVLELIAQRLPGSVRRLEGALNRVLAQARMTGEPVTAAMAEDALRDWVPSSTCASPQDVLNLVAGQFAVTVDDLRGRGRSQRVSMARQVAILLLYEDAALNRSQIGRMLGGRDHTTVSYALERMAQQEESDGELRRQLRILREALRAPVPVPVSIGR